MQNNRLQMQLGLPNPAPLLRVRDWKKKGQIVDNNNPVSPTPVQPQTTQQSMPASAQPAPAVPPQIPVPPPEKGSNKAILWFIIGLVIIVLIVGGIYFFLSRQQQATNTATQQPMVQATPKPQDTVDALDRDLNALNVGTSADFTAVDSDLKQL